MNLLLVKAGFQTVNGVLIAKYGRPFAFIEYPRDFFPVFPADVSTVGRSLISSAGGEDREEEVLIEPVPFSCSGQIPMMAAPPVKIRAIRDACSHGISVYVP